MKFIGKYLNTIGLILLFGFATAAAALYFDAPAKMTPPRAVEKKQAASGCGHESSGCCSPAKSANVHAGCSHDASTD